MCIPKLPHCRVIPLPHPETLTIILSLFQCLEYTDCSPVFQQCKLSSQHHSDRFRSALKGFLVHQKSIYCIHLHLFLFLVLGHCNRLVTIVFMATPADCFRVYKIQLSIWSSLLWNGCIAFICAVQPSASPSLCNL